MTVIRIPLVDLADWLQANGLMIVRGNRDGTVALAPRRLMACGHPITCRMPESRGCRDGENNTGGVKCLRQITNWF